MPKIYGYTEILGDILITGSFSVLGSASTINTTNLVVSDTIISLGHSQSGSPVLDEGIMFGRGTGLTQAFIWDETNDTFALIGTNDDHTVVGSINIDSYSNLRVGGLTTSTIKITNGASNGYYLTSNSSGDASWTQLTGGLTGSGATNYVSKWSGSGTLTDSKIYDNGTVLGINGWSSQNTFTVQSNNELATINVSNANTSTSTKKGMILSVVDPGSSTNNVGLQLAVQDALAQNYGIYSTTTGASGSTNYGAYFLNNSNAGNNYGVYTNLSGAINNQYGHTSVVSGSTNRNYGVDISVSGANLFNYGIQNQVSGTATTNYGIYNTVLGGLSNTYGIYTNISSGTYGRYYGNYVNISTGVGNTTWGVADNYGSYVRNLGSASTNSGIYSQVNNGDFANNAVWASVGDQTYSSGDKAVYANVATNASNITYPAHAGYFINQSKTSNSSTSISAIVVSTQSSVNYGVYVDSSGSTTNYGVVVNRGTSVFNENGDANTDFRIEGDTDQNLFFVDSSSNNIGIGNNTPSYKLEVSGIVSTTGFRMTDGAVSNYILTSDSTGVASWTSSESIQENSVTTILFDKLRVYNTRLSPLTGNLTADLTDSKLGMIQKIYHNDSITPTLSGGNWNLLSGTYTPSALNIIYAEWVTSSEIEYWII